MSAELLARLAVIVPIGLLSGLLAGAFGIGGGIVSVPLVKHLVGVSAHVAIGTTLAVILPTSLMGAYTYLKSKKLIVSLALICGIPAIVGTIFGSHYSHAIEGKHLMVALAALMMLVGLDFVSGLGNKLKAQGGAEGEEFEFKMDTKSLMTGIIIGIVVGLLSGLLGIGGGFIMVPAFCYLLRLPLKVAFGTSLVVIAVVSLPGTIVHAMHQHVDLGIAAQMLAGSVPGAWLGSKFSLRTKDQTLRSIFGSILIVLSILFAWRELA